MTLSGPVACAFFLSPFFSSNLFGGERFYHYVGQLSARSVLLAWGVTGPSGNTIGRDSAPFGKAVVRVAGRTLASEQNWLVVEDLIPDTTYPYEIDIDGRWRGAGEVRTWEERSERFCFLVIGDYGNGSAAQYRVAEAMSAEVERRAAGNCPVRFVLTVGDNMYADANFGFGILTGSGDLDSHWDRKFFAPYEKVLRRVPFLATLGNHDGNESENRGDLFAYLDNFFFPGNEPARWYTFTYGGFAQFISLDSTANSELGPPAPVYLAGGPQSVWLERTLAESNAAWKIPYFHHPIYNAGPLHPAYLQELKHWVRRFEESGVKVAFSGHEHNFQFTERERTGGIVYVIAGSGGELRDGDVRRTMTEQHIAGWSPTHIFLSVEIEGRTMRIEPISPDPFEVVDSLGKAVAMPVTIG